jgi:ketosteroid isomerase-like protein
VLASTRATILAGVGISDEQKIQRVNDLFELMNAGEFDAALELGHPDIVLGRAGSGGELRGRESLRAWMEPDAFESQFSEVLGHEVDGDRVLARVHTSARGAGSGIEISLSSWIIYSYDDLGRITRVQIFLEHEEEEARRAFGA